MNSLYFNQILINTWLNELLLVHLFNLNSYYLNEKSLAESRINGLLL